MRVLFLGSVRNFNACPTIRPSSIDLILASPPCQPHSLARLRLPKDESSKREAYRVIRAALDYQPEYVVIENVPGFLNWNNLERYIGMWRRAGYQVLTQRLNASWYGVPQLRDRLFIICRRSAYPPPIFRGRQEVAPGWDTIIEWGEHESRWVYGDKPRPLKRNTIIRIEQGMQELGRKPFLVAYYGIKNKAKLYEPPGKPMRTIPATARFGLLWWDGNMPMYRMVQASELGKAMGFHEDMNTEAELAHDKIKLIGNAVCPPVMRAVVQELMR